MSRIRLLLALALLPVLTFAAGTHEHAAQGHGPEQTAWGIAGDPHAAKRTIAVAMGDDMRFDPAAIVVKQGETVRFRVTNKGKLPHEFVLGTRQALDEHAVQMRGTAPMEHNEPFMASVKPGATADLVWTFNRAGTFDFACLVPGHAQAGMVGKLTVTSAR